MQKKVCEYYLVCEINEIPLNTQYDNNKITKKITFFLEFII